MTPQILICDDEISLAAVVADYLRGRGMIVYTAATGKEALEMFHSVRFDLCLLELGVQQKSGMWLLEQIRKEGYDTLIYVLSRKTMREEMIRAYEAGCDNYITKPFSMEVLAYQIEAAMRREQRRWTSKKTEYILYNDIIFDSVRQTLGDIHLSGRENDLLQLLFENKNQVIDKHFILRTLWQRDDDFAAHSLAVFINKLRRLLAPMGYLIKAVRGQGYKLITK